MAQENANERNQALQQGETGKRIGHRFQPGISGNPNGRRPKRLVDDCLHEALRAKRGAKRREIIDALLARAASGNVAALKLVFERVGGKPKPAVQINAPGQEALTLEQVRQRLAELLSRPEVRQGLLAILETPKDAAVQ